MASSPYSSKLLRSIIRQTHRLRAQATQAWLRTKHIAAWSAQLAVATTYGCWQWLQKGWQQGHQFAQGITSSWLKLTATAQQTALDSLIPADAPICQTLAWANGEPPVATPSAFCLLSLNPVKGIATDLNTGRLAWVTPNNTVVIVNETDHSALQERIAWELANHSDRLRQKQHQIEQESVLIRWSHRIHGAQVLAWIWQAVLHFFGSRRSRCLEPECDRLGSSSISTFTFGLFPGILTWQHPAVTWMTQILVQGYSSSDQNPWEESPAYHSRYAQLAPTFLDKNTTASPRLNSTSTAINGTVGMAISMPTDASNACLDIPVTVVGYGRSPLIWLIAGLDWVLVRLERQLAWVWKHMRRFVKAIQARFTSHRDTGDRP